MALMGMVLAGGVVGAVGRGLKMQQPFSSQLPGVVLWSGVLGLTGYVFYGLGLPGSSILEGVMPGLRGFLIGFVGGLLPLIAVAWLFGRGYRSN